MLLAWWQEGDKQQARLAGYQLQVWPVKPGLWLWRVVYPGGDQKMGVDRTGTGAKIAAEVQTRRVMARTQPMAVA